MPPPAPSPAPAPSARRLRRRGTAGWLALGTEQAVVAPVGMPTTGNPAPATDLLLGLARLAALLCAVAGQSPLRRQGARG